MSTLTEPLYDLVYILKRDELNPELRYSLRAVCKFCKFRKIWLAGYSPKWVVGTVNLDLVQKSNKWVNSTNNLIEVCKQNDLTDNFILMNDDFFPLRPVINWEKSLNFAGDYLDVRYRYYLNKYKEKISSWQKAFNNTDNFLRGLGLSHFNYELHIPMIVNKYRFLEMMSLPEVQKFRNSNDVFMKRSIYRNMYPMEGVGDPIFRNDVKLFKNHDATASDLNGDWLSVLDNVVNDDLTYPRLTDYFRFNFGKMCKYETL